MTIVDTHAHLYSEDTERYPRIEKPYLPHPGRGTIEDLREERRANGVARVVAVQTFTMYGHDNRLILDAVRENRAWMTGVLNADPFDLATPGLLERARELGVRGNRVHGWPADGSVLPEHRRLWEEARRLRLVNCALLSPANCASLARLLEEFPQVPVVLDHCANLGAADHPDSENLKTVLDLARYPNLYAKLSFLVTGSREEFPCRDLFAITRRVIDAYTPQRCMWGSDFPTSRWIPKVTYQQHLEIFQEHLGLSAAEQAAILGETAMRLWF